MLDRKQQPAILPITQLEIPRPEIRSLDNGIILNIFQRNEEDVVRFDIVVHAGIWQQTQPLQALFTNRMLREGTTDYSSKEISSSLDFYGAWLDLSCSYTKSYITLYSLGKYFEETLKLVHSMIIQPDFPSKEFDVMVAHNKQQYIINQTKTEYTSQKMFMRKIFGESHPCGYFASEHDYDQITTNALKKFHRMYYHNNNVTLYTSGNVTDKTVDTINKLFGNSQWGEWKERESLKPISMQTSASRHEFIEHSNAVQSSIRIGCPTINYKNPDYQKLRVVATLLGGYFGSRLMKNIREDKGFTYGISANIIPYPDSGLFIISTEVANEYVEPTINEIYKEIKKLQEENVDEKEIQMVKNYSIGEFCRSFEGMFSLSDAYIMLETYGLKDDYFKKNLHDIIHITSEEIRSLAQKYMKIEYMIDIIAGKKI